MPQINVIPDQTFANLPKLIQLDLSACQIQNVSSSAFEGLPALQILFLGDNQQVTSVPQNLPASLQKLYLQVMCLYTNKTMQQKRAQSYNEYCVVGRSTVI